MTTADGRYEHRIDALADRIGAQRGTGQQAAAGFLTQGGGQAAGGQDAGQILGLGLVKLPLISPLSKIGSLIVRRVVQIPV